MPTARLAACSLAALLAASAAFGQDAAELELDHTLSLEFETPHVKWAKPYARGTLRVLLFCNGRGTVPREGVELMQRFDLKIDAVFWRRIVDTTKEGWHGGDLGLQRMLRLAEKPYDCTVFLGVRPDQLTSEVQVKVLQPVVEGGKGIVCVGVNDKRIFKPDRKLGKLPPFIARAEPKAAYEVGKGRGVLLPGLPRIDYDVGWQFDYEAWQERFGRAIVWASGRAPERASCGLRLEWQDNARGDPPLTTATVYWQNLARSRISVEWQVRREDGVVIPLKSTTTREAEGRLSEKLPRLRVGRYRLDATVRQGKAVVAWQTVPFEAQPWARCGSVKLDCASGWGEVGGRIRGKVSLTRRLNEGERVEVRLLDQRGRLLLRQTLAEVEAFELPIAPWLPMLVRVEAARCDDRGDLAVAHAWFQVVKRHRGQFNFLIWDVPSGPTAPYAEESLARLGTTLQLKGGAPPRHVAACDVAWVPYTTRILERQDKNGLMQPQCWNDAAKVQAYVTGLAEKYRGARQHGVFVYSLGDENHVRGSCLSPQCLKAYRTYLKEVYGTVAKLNASWGSTCKSFDDVALLQADDNQASEAKRQKNYPRWYDRQAFRSWNYVQYCKAFARAYRAIDPQSRTGFEGAGRFDRGDDLDLFVRELEFWSPYPGTADEVLRSIAPRDFPRSNWMGYRKDATSLIAKYWRMVTRGCDSVWWWRWDGIGRFHGFLAPHLGPWPATKELVEDTQIVRDGLGTLLLRSEMLDSGIAMLFSHPSLYANKIEGSTSYGSVEQNHKAWHRAIRDLGLQFRYVTDRQLRLGEFDARRTKVLILSQSEAIGAKEAAVIRRFVENGGSLAADVRPGIYDGRCKPRQAGILDDLLGIRRSGRREAVKAAATIDMQDRFLTVKDARGDPDVTTTNGQAGGRAGALPVMITNESGAGQTLLLNFAMSSYPRLDLADTPEAAAELFLGLAADAGVFPPIRTTTGGRRTRDLETVRWRNGDIELVALFRHTGDDEDVQVELAQPRHVRDLRFRRSFDGVRAFPTKVLGSRPTWLALSPKPLASVKATLPKPKVPRGTQPVLRLQVPGAQGLHAVRIRATTPEGKPAEWLHRVVIVGAEPVEVPLPIALNDPKGQWTLRAIDLFTDTGPTASLTVE